MKLITLNTIDGKCNILIKKKYDSSLIMPVEMNHKRIDSKF